MKTDIEIATNVKLKHIRCIAKKINISTSDLEYYGNYKAKILTKNNNLKQGNLILVTAMSPTKAGEGKTTTSIGLADGLNKLGKKTILCLREPSLGPCFGMKGGACGGGYAQVVPMEDINLHFTGDLHAISAAHNLIAAMIDNSIFQDNILNIDPNKVTWKRVVDLNDRTLREITIGLGTKNGVSRTSGYDITVASEIMAILCLAEDLMDLKKMVKKIVVAYTYDDQKITVGDLKAEEAVTILLKDAIKPNLVQTLEHTPTLIHGGPFANIAHGCNSLIATKLALSHADYVVTEAGFGFDLGGEKFFDLKCRIGNLKPNLVVLVATIRALKLHGNVDYDNINLPNLEALKLGLKNLERHYENILKYNVPVIIALNKFSLDNQEEIDYLTNYFPKKNIHFVLNSAYLDGGKGALKLAEIVVNNIKPSKFKPLYNINESILNKIKIIAKEIYRAKDVELTDEAKRSLEKFERLGYGNLLVCIAKTQYSFSDNPKLLGAPNDHILKINELRLAAGAGFIIALSGNIMTMPGLPKVPIATKMKIDIKDEKEIIEGLF